MIKLLFIPVVLYVLFALLVYASQSKLIYYPSAFVPAASELESLGLRHWPAEPAYRGFTSIVENKQPHAVMVFFHGNASLAYTRPELAESLTAAGFRVVMAEYPGYGGRSGTPSEAALVADAVETVRLAHGEFGLPVYLWGESLGSGVATGVVTILQNSGQPLEIEGLVLQVPFDSLPNVAQHHYWYLPARRLIKDRYNSVNNLSDYRGRVVVLVAENDNVVPSQFGVSLYESLDTEKQLWTVKEAGHSFEASQASPWWDEVLGFLSQSR